MKSKPDEHVNLRTAHIMCIRSLCTTVVHSTAHNSHVDLPSKPSDEFKPWLRCCMLEGGMDSPLTLAAYSRRYLLTCIGDVNTRAGALVARWWMSVIR